MHVSAPAQSSPQAEGKGLLLHGLLPRLPGASGTISSSDLSAHRAGSSCFPLHTHFVLLHLCVILSFKRVFMAAPQTPPTGPAAVRPLQIWLEPAMSGTGGPGASSSQRARPAAEPCRAHPAWHGAAAHRDRRAASSRPRPGTEQHYSARKLLGGEREGSPPQKSSCKFPSSPLSWRNPGRSGEPQQFMRSAVSSDKAPLSQPARGCTSINRSILLG